MDDHSDDLGEEQEDDNNGNYDEGDDNGSHCDYNDNNDGNYDDNHTKLICNVMSCHLTNCYCNK